MAVMEKTLHEDSGNILVVDDNLVNLRLLTKILRHEYKVCQASDGAGAMATARAELPDLILLDIVLPDMSGYEVCKSLKADDPTRGIPIIFISILNEVGDKLKAFSVGGVDYMTKPFFPKEVLARVGTHLSLRKMQKCLEVKNEMLGQEVMERKLAEKALQDAHDDLETQVRARTSELRKTNETLRDVNTALNVLLKKRAEDKESFKENVLINIKELMLPYIERLKKSRLGENQRTLVDIMESNLDTIASPLISRLSSKYLNLTPTEVRVAHFVRDGKTNKEIAELMGLSVGTILTHRHHVRRKLGLRNKKANLRTHLLSLE
ncbi:response regulator [Desulfobacterales bacterium HSG2]|nr:response regulator [Desulfobacterales bacterium HSG2]